MTDRHADVLYQRLLASDHLTDADRAHARSCQLCQRAIRDFEQLDDRLRQATLPLASEPLPDGTLSGDRSSYLTLARIGLPTMALVLLLATVIGLGLSLSSVLRPTGNTTPSSTPQLPIPSLSPEQQDAVRFRTDFGLRSDLAYIAQVARDPSAVLEFGVPLLPFEVQDLRLRQVGADVAVPIASAYGEQHPDDFAGLYLDQGHGGALVVLFTANLSQHTRDLWSSLLSRTPPIAVQVKPARWTIAYLSALQGRIVKDMDAWAAQGIQIVTIGTRIPENAVEIVVLAPAATAERQLAAAYGADAIIVYITDKPPQPG